MKLLERTSDRLVFGLSRQEKNLLLRLVSFYPIPSETPPMLSRNGGRSLAEAEAFLRTSLEEQQVELAGWLKSKCCEGGVIASSGGEWRLSLDGSETERLLQVLNGLRVVAWTRLGSPDEVGEASMAMSPEQVPMHAIMQLAGQFEMVLLHALHGDLGTSLRATE